MRIARIDTASSVVANVEMASAEWVAANANDPLWTFVPIPDGDPVDRGDRYDPDSGTFLPARERTPR